MGTSVTWSEIHQPMLYTLSGWEMITILMIHSFHIEMDELPNSYDETTNNYKWFYGWNKRTTATLGLQQSLYTYPISYYSRWYQNMNTLFDEMFAMNDGVRQPDPTNLQVYNQSLNHITLKWDRSSSYDFDTYEILYSTALMMRHHIRFSPEATIHSLPLKPAIKLMSRDSKTQTCIALKSELKTKMVTSLPYQTK